MSYSYDVQGPVAQSLVASRNPGEVVKETKIYKAVPLLSFTGTVLRIV